MLQPLCPSYWSYGVIELSEVVAAWRWIEPTSKLCHQSSTGDSATKAGLDTNAALRTRISQAPT